MSVSPGTIIATWKKAVCEEGISHYRIYRDGQVVANTFKDVGSLILENQPIGIPLKYKVLAVTNNFRTSFESNEIEVTLTGSSTADRLLNDYTLNFYL